MEPIDICTINYGSYVLDRCLNALCQKKKKLEKNFIIFLKGT